MGDAPVAGAPSARDAAFDRDLLACLPDVARFARSLTRDASEADDLVQETYLLAYRGYHTFREGEDPRRWLFTICRHHFTRHRRREERFVETEEGSDAELDTLAAVMGHVALKRSGEDDIFRRLDLAPAIREAIASLSESMRVVVTLVDMEGESYESAAAIEGVPVGTIRSRLFRARRILQERLIVHARDAGIRK
jgi:RNA polymerase sigma-70 factor (ECF subfamily)